MEMDYSGLQVGDHSVVKLPFESSMAYGSRHL